MEIIELVESLPRTKSADVIGRQLLRSATSVGANYRSARRAQSNAQFIAKMNIALEEADECLYWLELWIETGSGRKEAIHDLLKEANELTAIFTTSIKTARRHSKLRT